ncbi:MAG: fluoride efflux transporter CrcB [Pseudonocardiaceae bacterium]|nr:fluoride efflux transporter CrcB [Pseudonocardiaceae bacterium]
MWLHVLAVAAGGAAGATARFLVTKASATYLGTAFPYHTLFVNVVGSLLLGAITGLALGRVAVPETVRLLVGVGFCGAFTTFSTFAVETLVDQSVEAMILNVTLNNVLSIGAAALGLYVGMRT